MDDRPESIPSDPQGEIVLADEDEPLFVAACKAVIVDEAERFGWSLGNSLLTRSAKWGLVWRVDFFLDGQFSPSPPWFNRAVFCGEKDGTVNGTVHDYRRQVAPLA
jgi:hypothetical protein